MPFRSIVAALLLSFTLTACDAVSSNSCSSPEDIAQLASALSDDLQRAEEGGRIDRTKTADAMGRMLLAGQALTANRDRRAYCAALDKIRRDTGI